MKKFGLITTLVAATAAMTLVSCGGGSGTKERAYVNFVMYGENVPVFEKQYDGQPAAISAESVRTNSDGQVVFTWQSKGAEGNTNLEAAPSLPGDYYIEVSVAETAKFTAAKTGHDYKITKATMPETWITKAADFPEVLHFTKSGSGNSTQRTPNAEEVALIKEKISVNDGSKAWVQGTDYDVVVSIASGRNDPANGTIAINPIDNPLYSGRSLTIPIALAS